MIIANWNIKLLGDVCTFQRGFDLPYRLRKPGPIPIVTSSGIEDTHCQAKVKGPGVVTGRYGTIGEVFFVKNDFWPLNTTLFVRDFHDNDPLFVSYFLRTLNFHVHSGKSGVPGVNRNDLHEIVVLFPSIKAEQEAIAQALSDADALIESLEQLVAKKRHIKQGAMQELLTGKTRLPGFNGEWVVKRLKFIAPLQRGFDLPNRMLKAGRYPVVYSNGILKHHAGYIVKGPGVVTGRSGTLGVVHFIAEDFWPHNTTLWVTDFKGNDPKFIYYLYCYIQLDQFGTGSGVPTLNRNDVHELDTFIPTAFTEQTAIADVLTETDSEIAALEAKLEKARQLKQGMMQELLTGRIRLV